MEALVLSGGATRFLDRMQSRDELHEVIGYRDYEALDREVTGGLPDAPPGSGAP